MSLIVVTLFAWLAGRRLLRFGGMSGIEAFLFQMYVGFSVVAVLTVVVGSLSLRWALFVSLMLTAVVLTWELFAHPQRFEKTDRLPESVTRFNVVERIALGATGCAAFLALAGALAPATGWDATVAHLALPADYALEGRLYLASGNEYSAYPHLAHSLYSLIFFANGETPVQLLSWLFGLMACGAAFLLGRRIHGRETGLVSAAILATAPIFYDQASTTSIDLLFCGFTLMALAAFAAWRQDGAPIYLVLAGLLAGASCGVRHTGYLVAVLLAAAVLCVAKGTRGKSALVLAGAVSLAAGPWLLRSAWLVGNPVYPFFDGFFSSGILPHRNVTVLGAHESIKGVGLRSFLMFPWDIVMRPHWFDGWTKSPGGLILFLGIPGLILGGARARYLGMFSAAGLTAFYFFQRLARYLLPFFAPMMIVAALAVSRGKSLRPVASIALTVSFVFTLGLDVAAVHVKVPVLAGWETRDEYLARRVERYAAFQWVNQNLPMNDTIFTFDRRQYYFACRAYQNDQPLKALREKPIAEQANWFRVNGIRWIFIPVTFMEESEGYRREFGDMVAAWRQDLRYFRPYKVLDVPRARSTGTERVEIYEVIGVKNTKRVPE